LLLLAGKHLEGTELGEVAQLQPAFVLRHPGNLPDISPMPQIGTDARGSAGRFR